MEVFKKVVVLQAQLVGERRVKVDWQFVQVEASVQVSQLLIAEEHIRQVVLRY